jgi:2-methylisocitrate lyase-like PEP mutase family enzyme
VAGLHIEDQGFPKKCGHLEGKVVIPLEEYLPKIRAAVSARGDPDFLIVARTDSRAVFGFDEAIHRANAALDAGADMAFVEAVETEDELAQVPRLVHGPCLLNMVWGGKTPAASFDDAQKLGYKLAILPGLLFTAVMELCETILGGVARTGTLPETLSVRDGFRRVGSDEWDRLRDQFR